MVRKHYFWFVKGAPHWLRVNTWCHYGVDRTERTNLMINECSSCANSKVDVSIFCNLQTSRILNKWCIAVKFLPSSDIVLHVLITFPNPRTPQSKEETSTKIFTFSLAEALSWRNSFSLHLIRACRSWQQHVLLIFLSTPPV